MKAVTKIADKKEEMPLFVIDYGKGIMTCPECGTSYSMPTCKLNEVTYAKCSVCGYQLGVKEEEDGKV